MNAIIGSSVFHSGAHASPGQKDEVMSAAKISALAGAIAIFGTAALGADLSFSPPPPQVVTTVDTGWYLRGFLG